MSLDANQLRERMLRHARALAKYRRELATLTKEQRRKEHESVEKQISEILRGREGSTVASNPDAIAMLRERETGKLPAKWGTIDSPGALRPAMEFDCAVEKNTGVVRGVVDNQGRPVFLSDVSRMVRSGDAHSFEVEIDRFENRRVRFRQTIGEPIFFVDRKARLRS